ncbi:MAG: YgjV family protein [Ruminococcaceae bacterium]|nr:YgjV family protein [Oscillospiraceae bacterium]
MSALRFCGGQNIPRLPMIDFIKSIDPMELIAQAVGIVAMASYCLSFQFKKNAGCITMQFLGSGLFCLHFLLLGSIGGFLMNLIGVCRAVTLLFGERTHRPIFLGSLIALFIGGSVVCVICSWDSPLVFLTCAGQVVGLLGLWSRDSKKLRLAQFFGTSPAWIVYSVINRSVGGLLCEIFNMLSIAVYFVRMRLGRVKVTEKES